jgi:hypothetical protein
MILPYSLIWGKVAESETARKAKILLDGAFSFG